MPSFGLFGHFMRDGDNDASSSSDDDEKIANDLASDADLIAATLSLDVRTQRKKIRQQLTDPYEAPFAIPSST